MYEDAVGSLRFLLDVENANDYPVERVRASVVLQNEEGRTVASQSAYARLDLLGPGERAPVMVVFYLASPDFATHDIRLEAQEADYLMQLLNPALEIVDPSGRVGEWVPYEVLGKAHNASSLDAESVTLAVTCFDAQGRIVAIGTGRPDDRSIPAGESSEFLVSLGAVAGDVDRCRVQVEGLVPTGN
ncbi:MAG TPA: FxLYD domain-containing protein [Anaerolineae bacterium]|nr:FxLYD domain-containing protein [Anaerolineae bacterium]